MSPTLTPTDTPIWKPVPILMYHAVETNERPPKYKHFYVTAKEFAGQMRMLRHAGYQAITFDTLARAKAGETALPRKPVLLTFDDGYDNLLANVHPVLRDLGYPYTVFLVSERIGLSNDWVAAEGYEPTSLLGWERILQMQADGGVDFQAHTATHRHLDALTADDAREELAASRDSLEQRLQKPVTTLCYPYGSHDSSVRDYAREAGYAQAVTTEFGRVRREDDALQLPRISVYHVPPVSLTYGVGAWNFRWRLEARKDKRP